MKVVAALFESKVGRLLKPRGPAISNLVYSDCVASGARSPSGRGNTQPLSIILARKAERSPGPIVSAWLFKTVGYDAATADLRGANRRGGVKLRRKWDP